MRRIRAGLVSGVWVLLLLVAVFGVVLNVPVVRASGTIYIRANGLVEGTDKIMSVDNITYTFTDDINDSIVVQRNNILVDGNGYALRGGGGGIGIDLSYTHDVTIRGIRIMQFQTGIMDAFSYRNILLGNNVSANSWIGIRLHWSSDNVLRNNNMEDNRYDFGVYGDYYSHFRNDIDSSNLVHGRPVYYWIERQDMSVPLDAGYVALYECKRIFVQNLTLSNNGQGILLYHTEDSTVLGNNVSGNVNGIQLYFSWNNVVCENNVSDSEGDSGISIDSSLSNNISRNNVASNGNGVMVTSSSKNNTIVENSIILNDWAGIYIQYDSIYNELRGNNITQNEYGIILDGDSNQVFHNYVGLNNDYGIEIRASSGNTLRENHVTDNKRGFKITATVFSSLVNDIDTSNTVNSRPIYYWVSKQDATVPRNAGFLALINCVNITAQDLNISGNWQGVFLGYTNSSRIVGSNLSNNSVGIELHFAFGNTITQNELCNNTDCGVYLYQSFSNRVAGNVIANNYVGVDPFDSSNNVFAHNQFLSNIVHVEWGHLLECSNSWNDSYYSGGGNYWSGFSNEDNYSGPLQDQPGSDGIWDHPLHIGGANTDFYPVVPEFDPLLALPLFMIATLLAVIVYRRKRIGIR